LLINFIYEQELKFYERRIQRSRQIIRIWDIALDTVRSDGDSDSDDDFILGPDFVSDRDDTEGRCCIKLL